MSSSCTKCKNKCDESAYCDGCPAIYCNDCRHLNLPPHGNPVSLQGVRFCIKCFPKNMGKDKDKNDKVVWPMIDINKWARGKLSKQDVITAEIAYDKVLDELY